MKEYREKSDSRLSDKNLVVVAHAQDWDLANDYAMILKDYGIQAVIDQREECTDSFGFALKVHEDFFDESHMIIQSQQTHNSFYDFFFDEAYFDQEDDDCDCYDFEDNE